MFPGDAYNNFMNKVREDTSHDNYSNPNDSQIKGFGVGLVVYFTGKDGNGYLKVY